MDPRLTVACVYTPGNGFTAEYIFRLKRGFAEHCKAPHRFVALTASPVLGVECVPLRHKRVSWWNKLELFRKGLFAGPVVYADLDTLIVRDVTDICTADYDFASICDIGSSAAPGEVVLNSGFMAWDGTQDLSHICEAYTDETPSQYERMGWRRWGDQGFIQDHLGKPFTKLQDQWCGRFVHYKSDIRGPNKELGVVPRNASIVLFSGRPRPHEIGWEIPLEH